MALKARDEIYYPKDQDGLGFHRFKDIDIALL